MDETLPQQVVERPDRGSRRGRQVAGEVFLELGPDDAAIGKQAVEIRPDYPAAHCQLGLIYYQQRNWEGAIPELEMGVEGYGDLLTYRNAFCYYTLGLSYFYLARCEDAYPLFDQVLEAIPDNAPAEEGIRLCREAEAEIDQPQTPEAETDAPQTP